MIEKQIWSIYKASGAGYKKLVLFIIVYLIYKCSKKSMLLPKLGNMELLIKNQNQIINLSMNLDLLYVQLL